ncbi:MAG: antibiotic biosynthesis monooxygenase family protein [Betaproteobacteria bacterium]
MIAVIFEFTPAPGRKQDYLDLAVGLSEALQGFDGFVSIERFESISAPGRFVSLSFWRDEEAVRKWRNVQKHREAQAKGRREIFSSYRLRVAHVLRDYSKEQREEAPEDSLIFHTSIHG